MADSSGGAPSNSGQSDPPKTSELADVGTRQAFAFWAFHPDSMVYAYQSQPAASGLITFVATVRHMMSFLSNVSREDFVKRLHATQHPVFFAVLACQPIAKKPIDRDALMSVMHTFSEANANPSVSRLMEDPVVCSILWSQKHAVTAVFEEPIQHRPNKESAWKFGMPSGGLPSLPAEDGLLSFDDGSKKSLSAHLFDEYQGHLANDMTDDEVYRRFRGPVFLRVKITIKAGHLKYHDDLCQLQLLGGSGHRFYRCIAVVKLRQHESEGDLLRLFQPSGEAWYPYCESNKFKFPMTNDWNVDGLGEYLYIYVRVPKTTYDRKCETSSAGLELQSTIDAAGDALDLLDAAIKGTSSQPPQSDAPPPKIQPPPPPAIEGPPQPPASPPFVPRDPPMLPTSLTQSPARPSTPVVPKDLGLLDAMGDQQHGTKRGLDASGQESEPAPKKTRQPSGNVVPRSSSAQIPRIRSARLQPVLPTGVVLSSVPTSLKPVRLPSVPLPSRSNQDGETGLNQNSNA